jgi:hypothetical protein
MLAAETVAGKRTPGGSVGQLCDRTLRPGSATTPSGITAYLKNKGTLEHAQTIANHASPRTTKLYDRRSDAGQSHFRKVRVAG